MSLLPPEPTDVLVEAGPLQAAQPNALSNSHGAPPNTPDAGVPGDDTATPAGAGRPGRPPRARWERPAFVALLLVTGALYLWDLSASGWANSFYAAAAQAGSQSWKAFLFGASDAAGSITVDKPPAALWVMGLSVRAFGLSSWSVLAPQALMGVATVATLYASIRRRFSPQAALLGGTVLALTPVGALMFRYDNPDALLVLLLTLAAYCTIRAIEDGRSRWMIFAGALVGLGFLTKQLQAFLVLPGFAVAYLVGAPLSLRRRIGDGLLALGAMSLAAGWWVALVELVPASMRPYVGGSQNNSFLELTFGYNGLGRLTGNETGSVGGGAGAAAGGSGSPFSAQSGIGRLFATEAGGQIAWLIPAALILALAALWLRRRAGRTDPARSAVIVWGSWLIVTALTFSLMAGTFHAYYTVALAPAIAALVGIGTALLWDRREELWIRAVLALTTITTAGEASILLGRTADWLPWLRWAILAAGLLGAAGLLAGHRIGSRTLAASAALAIVSGLAGPTAYTVQTVTTAHSGGIVVAGPTVAGGSGFPQGRPPGGSFRPDGLSGTVPPAGSAAGDGAAPSGIPGGTPSGIPGGAPTGIPGAMTGGAGGDRSQVGTKIKALLLKDAASYTWVAATVGADNAAGYQLATQEPVMPIGGFTGSDPSPTLAQFKAYVTLGKVHYLIGNGRTGPTSNSSSTQGQISAWVKATFTAQTVDGTTIYDLTRPAASSSATSAQ